MRALLVAVVAALVGVTLARHKEMTEDIKNRNIEHPPTINKSLDVETLRLPTDISLADVTPSEGNQSKVIRHKRSEKPKKKNPKSSDGAIAKEIKRVAKDTGIAVLKDVRKEVVKKTVAMIFSQMLPQPTQVQPKKTKTKKA